MKRTHYCAEVGALSEDETVRLYGWIDAMRDHGGVVFVDLRDRTGIVQVVIDPEEPDAGNTIPELRAESVLGVTGTVRMRPVGTENPTLKTGRIEISAKNVAVLSQAQPLPFQFDDPNVGEEVRFRHRYLDLRQPQNQIRLRARSDFVAAVRGFLHAEGFIDIETPMLTRSTPEGARDFLVPARFQPGAFYALPQSPQLFKQSLMGAGFDRYYQIVKCFRDEDFRSDRQAEFTQIDIEMSFVEPEDVIALAERMVVQSFHAAAGIELPTPFPRMPYADAMREFATDCPDLRNPLRVCELTDLMKKTKFKVFNEPATDPHGRVVGLRVPDAQLTRQQISQLTEFVGKLGAKGLAYIKVEKISPVQLQSPIVKFLDEALVASLLELMDCKDGDMIFFGAGRVDVVNRSMSALRNRLCSDLNLAQGKWAPVWITGFPLFGYDYMSKTLFANHHPFTSPGDDDLASLASADHRKLQSKAYDLVLNGIEIGGGSIRIHDKKVQLEVLELLGIGRKEAEEKFGFLLNVLSHGMPPHGGIAMGVDRIVQIMTGAASIRDVIAFPKTQRGQCLFTDAPSPVGDEQIKELGLKRTESV